MKNQTEPEQTLAWEAPVWLRDALTFNALPSQGEDDHYESADSFPAEDHPLGFV